jgi:hypothetical protein
MGNEVETAGKRYRDNAEGLAEASMRSETSWQEARQWSKQLQCIQGINQRRYLEGMYQISVLRTAQYNLLAEHYQKDGREIQLKGGNAKPGPDSFQGAELRFPVVKKSNISVNAMLADCCRELGSEHMARLFEAQKSNGTEPSLSLVRPPNDRELL